MAMDWITNFKIEAIRGLTWMGAAGLATMAITAMAAPYTYDGTAMGPLDWSTDLEWDAPPASAVDTDLIFGNGMVLGDGATVFSNQNIATPFLLNSLTFNYAGTAAGVRPTVTLTGGALQFSNDGPTGPTLVLSATGTVAGSVDTRPLLVIDNDVVLAADLGVSGVSIGWISGDISGAGGIAKSGTGTLILNGSNSYAGATTISAGVIEVRSNTALGGTAAGTTVSSGGQLALRDGVTITGETLSLRGDGFAGATATTQGALRNLAGNNTWAGTVNVDSSVTTRITSNTGTLTLSGPVITSGSVVNGLVFQGEGNIRISGALTGNAQVTRSTNGAGTLFLSGDNGIDDPAGATQILGKLTISNGEVVFEKRNAFYYKVAGVDVPIWTGANLIIAANRAIGFNVGAADEFTAADIKAMNGAAASSAIAANVQLWLNTANAAGGVFTYGLGLDNWGSGGALALNKQGLGTLELTAANTYSGLTTVEAGLLRITHGGALGATTGATTVSSNAGLELSGGITVTGETLSIIGGGVSGNGVLRSVNGHNTWAGDINVNTSTITRIAVDSASDSLTISGNVVTSGTNANGVVVQGSGTTSITGNISGDGAFTRSSNGNGLVVMSGANTYTGSTLISNGTLQVGVGGIGSIANTAAVTIGGGTLAGTGSVGGLVTLNNTAGSVLSAGDAGGVSAGTLTLTGGLSLHSTGGADLRFDLGTSSDLIRITGGAFTGNASGLTTFAFVMGAGFGNGTYDLIDWSALGLAGATNVETTDFNFTGLNTNYDAVFNITSAGVLQLVVTVVPEPSRALLMMLGLGCLVVGRRRK